MVISVLYQIIGRMYKQNMIRQLKFSGKCGFIIFILCISLIICLSITINNKKNNTNNIFLSAVNPNGSVHSDKEINILIPQLYYNENDTNKELLNKVNETLKYHKNKQLYTYGY